jgi:hypothetical protein
MSTFNGWTIVPLPAYPPCPKSIEWQLDEVVGAARSPFSQQLQTMDWGQSVLRASLSYPFMPPTIVKPWKPFLMLLRGKLNVFQFGDPLNVGPQNAGATAGTVTGSGQTGYALNTSSSGLLPGDWIQLGLRLYHVTSVSGGALTIWPPIRESPADGTSLIITNTQGLFRLTKNSTKLIVDEERFTSITFEIEEAL